MSGPATPIPCPFCGSADIDDSMALGGDGKVAAGCWDCGACAGDAPTKEEAVALWNTRTPQPATLPPSEWHNRGMELAQEFGGACAAHACCPLDEPTAGYLKDIRDSEAALSAHLRTVPISPTKD